MLEELLALGHRGAEYDAWLIKINDGEQFGSGFVAINPNSKIPALLDRSGPKPIRVFESGAILLYLAEKFGAFLPTDTADARRMPVVAVLADGQRTLPRRRLRPLLRLRADKDRIRDRSLRHGGETSARRSRSATGESPSIWRATTIRSPIWQSGPGMAASRRAGSMARANSCRSQDTRTCSAGPTRSATPRRTARAQGQSRLGRALDQLHERHDASDFETKTQDKVGGSKAP